MNRSCETVYLPQPLFTREPEPGFSLYPKIMLASVSGASTANFRIGS